MGFGVARGRILAISIDLLRRFKTLSHYRASVWCVMEYVCKVVHSVSVRQMYFDHYLPCANNAEDQHQYAVRGQIWFCPTVRLY